MSFVHPPVLDRLRRPSGLEDEVSQHPIELILMRQLASYLATPIFLLDQEGSLVYFNLPAESILGLRFDEIGEMAPAEWQKALAPTDREGQPLDVDRLAFVAVIRSRRPERGDFWIRGLDGVLRHVSVASFPLVGQARRETGYVAVCWLDDDT